MTTRIPVFSNARAGTKGGSGEDDVGEKFGETVEIIPIDPSELADAVKAKVTEGATIVGVAGGDGSLHTAAGALADTQAALLCIPTGTLNNFAKRLGITNIDEAVVALQTKKIETMALGSLQDDIFLNTLTFGEYARVVRMRERLRRYVGKWPAAAISFLVAATSLRMIKVGLHADDETVYRQTRLVWVGMGAGSFPRVYEATERRDSPDLEVAILRTKTRLDSVAFMARLAAALISKSGPVRDPDLEILQTRSLVLESMHRIDATADGEPLRLTAPVKVGVRDNALRVLIGPGERPA